MSAPALKLCPNDTITLMLSEKCQARAFLQIRNDSDSAVVFKIKTTTPERYLVKPNHGVISKGEKVEVSIVIAKVRKRALLAEHKIHGSLKSNDKFLVQSRLLDETTKDKLVSVTPAEQANIIANLFTLADKPSINARKLLVSLVCTDNEYSTLACEKNYVQTPIKPMTSPPIPSTPEAMFGEIVSLRNKYDDLVTFTLNLTAERDVLSRELQVIKHQTVSHESPSHLPALIEDTQRSANHNNRAGAKNSMTYVEVLAVAFCALLLGMLFPKFM